MKHFAKVSLTKLQLTPWVSSAALMAQLPDPLNVHSAFALQKFKIVRLGIPFEDRTGLCCGKIFARFQLTTLAMFETLWSSEFLLENADNLGPELQYLKSNGIGTAPFFSVIAESNNGDGCMTEIIPKCILHSSSYSFSRDEVTEWRLAARFYYDESYVSSNSKNGCSTETLWVDSK